MLYTARKFHLKVILVACVLIGFVTTGTVHSAPKPQQFNTKYYSLHVSPWVKQIAEKQSGDAVPKAIFPELPILPYRHLAKTVKQYNRVLPHDRFSRYFVPTPREKFQEH